MDLFSSYNHNYLSRKPTYKVHRLSKKTPRTSRYTPEKSSHGALPVSANTETSKYSEFRVSGLRVWVHCIPSGPVPSKPQKFEANLVVILLKQKPVPSQSPRTPSGLKSPRFYNLRVLQHKTLKAPPKISYSAEYPSPNTLAPQRNLSPKH